MNNIISAPISRRSFLRAGGVSLALPFLDSMWPTRVFGAPQASAPKRMVTICTTLGMHAPYFFPKTDGRGYEGTPYMDHIKEHRDHFTIFGGLSHPEQSGADGHSSGMTWLTSAKHPGLGGFRNSISVDQFAVEKIGTLTRHPSLSLCTGAGGQSYTRSGVLLPAEQRPSSVFAKLFLDGSPQQMKEQMQRLKDGQSIMDTVQAEAGSFQRRVGAADREKLDEYFTSVREMEQRLHKSEEWMQKPKPKLEGDDAKPPQDIASEADIIGRMKLMFDMIPLALQTDSTRLVTMVVNGRGDIPPVEGVTIDHHNLSHHGQDPAKIEQLRRVEEAQMSALNHLLTRLRTKKEGNASLLDNTMVLFGSNLGNANSHDWHNLPVLLAGGGFKHGSFVKYDEKDNTPFSNLFVAMLQNMGMETDHFGSSTGKLDWA